MISPAPTVDGDVSPFVRAVRARLRDLGPDVVEELTGGMEADLQELVADRGRPLRELLSSPERYADELRAAAELPPPGRALSPSYRAADEWAARWRQRAGRTSSAVRSQPWWPGAVALTHGPPAGVVGRPRVGRLPGADPRRLRRPRWGAARQRWPVAAAARCC